MPSLWMKAMMYTAELLTRRFPCADTLPLPFTCSAVTRAAKRAVKRTENFMVVRDIDWLAFG